MASKGMPVCVDSKYDLRRAVVAVSGEVARVVPGMPGRELAITLAGLGNLAAKDVAVDREVFALVSARVDGWAGGFSENELGYIAEGRRMFKSSVGLSDAGSTSVCRGTAGDVGSTSVYRGTASGVGTRERERWISALVGPRNYSKCVSTHSLTLVS